MRPSFRILYFSIALLLLIIILVLGQEAVIQYVVDPITRIIWWFIRILQTIDQKFYWTILIFLVFIFFVYIIPGKNNHKTRSAYTDPPQKEDRMQFWERSISSAIDNDGDRLILQSNLDLIQKEVAILFHDSKIEPIQLEPVKKKFGGRFVALFRHTALFSFLIKKNMIRTNELFVSLQDYLNSLETIMEKKNGNSRNKSSDS